MAKITGIGGIFFKSKDPKALSAWYRDMLGFPLQDWGGVHFPNLGSDGPPLTVWSPFDADTKYFAPSAASFMVNFAVDDLDGMLAALKAKGVEPLSREDQEGIGRFAWIMDPEGNKVELWEAK